MVMAGRELLWQETQPRLLNTISPLVSSLGRIFATAVFASGDPAAGLGQSSFSSFAPAFTRLWTSAGDSIREARTYAVSPRSFLKFGSAPFASSQSTIF